MGKYTPEPWEWSLGVLRGLFGQAVCVLPEGAEGPGEHSDEGHATQKLLKAAPKLAKALEEMLKCHDYDKLGCHCAESRAACAALSAAGIERGRI